MERLRRLIETSPETEQFRETYEEVREVLRPYEEETQRWANLTMEGKLGRRVNWLFWKNCYQWTIFKGEEEKGVYTIELRPVDGVLCQSIELQKGTETVRVNLEREGQIRKILLAQPSQYSKSLMDVRRLFPDSFNDTWVADRRFSKHPPVLIQEPGEVIPTVFPSAGYKIQEIRFFIRPEEMRLTTKSNWYNGWRNEAKVSLDGELSPLCRTSFPEILEAAMQHLFPFKRQVKTKEGNFYYS